MQFLVMVALAVTVYLGMVADWDAAAVDHPEAADEARLQVDLYRQFIYVGNTYMTQHAPASPAALTVDWATMSAWAPAPFRSAAMPASWKIVRAADMTWAACTPMDEIAANAISALDPADHAASANTALTLPVAGQAQAFIVVGDPAGASTWASLCQ